MQIHFISLEDSEVTHTVYTKSYNVEVMEGDKADEIIEELFESLLQNYKKIK